MALLVADQLCRLSEGNHGDGHAAAVELVLACAHLAEVFLAGQSSKMTQKDQQQALAKMRGKIDPMIRQIEQRQLGKINSCHNNQAEAASRQKKRGAPT
jgi:TolA-binding protein